MMHATSDPVRTRSRPRARPSTSVNSVRYGSRWITANTTRRDHDRAGGAGHAQQGRQHDAADERLLAQRRHQRDRGQGEERVERSAWGAAPRAAAGRPRGTRAAGTRRRTAARAGRGWPPRATLPPPASSRPCGRPAASGRARAAPVCGTPTSARSPGATSTSSARTSAARMPSGSAITVTNGMARQADDHRRRAPAQPAASCAPGADPSVSMSLALWPGRRDRRVRGRLSSPALFVRVPRWAASRGLV